ncbi:MAG: 3-methyl-2-oxobutanoate dehydrogenase subunit VorB [Spirochaetaceae bacterium]|nr:MAG: 3-methyl-2-oxobutanoate dehydrogenase subunit VorB [Spirochaetaceae bacterium]
MDKVLMKGNEAIAQAAIHGGCRYFFGYPITPQNEIPEYMAREMPKAGGVFLQAESEVAAINMVYGAAGAGARVMTSSSSPGIALKQEGFSYIVGSEVPCVIVNIMRGGPGLGGIQPSQADYYQATRGGGNGDYNMIVFAPANIQEAADLTAEAFEIADYYRNPVMILGDGMIGQMMEPVLFRETPKRAIEPKTWATTGTGGTREPNIITSLHLDPADLEKHNLHLQQKYARMRRNETRYEYFEIEDAEFVFVSYGTASRIVRNAIIELRQSGIRAGMIRPITVWPFPQTAFDQLGTQVRAVMAVELSCGQMVDDVHIAVRGRWPVGFHGRSGGMIPTQREIVEACTALLEEVT